MLDFSTNPMVLRAFSIGETCFKPIWNDPIGLQEHLLLLAHAVAQMILARRLVFVCEVAESKMDVHLRAWGELLQGLACKGFILLWHLMIFNHILPCMLRIYCIVFAQFVDWIRDPKKDDPDKDVDQSLKRMELIHLFWLAVTKILEKPSLKTNMT